MILVTLHITEDINILKLSDKKNKVQKVIEFKYVGVRRLLCNSNFCGNINKINNYKKINYIQNNDKLSIQL